MNNWKAKRRPQRQPQGRHGKIKRIVNSGIPMMSLYKATCETLFKEAAEAAGTEEVPEEFFLPNTPPKDE